MAKRFTDTSKWDDEWYISLPVKYKIFYSYVLDKCDHAGVWKVNFTLANFLTGQKFTENEVLEVFRDRVVALPKGYWFIVKFIDFQYGELNANNNAHKGVLRILSKFNILEDFKLGAVKGLVSQDDDSLGDKDKEKDKDMDKDKEKDKEKEYKETFFNSLREALDE